MSVPRPVAMPTEIGKVGRSFDDTHAQQSEDLVSDFAQTREDAWESDGASNKENEDPQNVSGVSCSRPFLDVRNCSRASF
jgi:hypothetical protein